MSDPSARIRPLSYDPSADTVAEAFDLASDEWWLTAGGEYHTAAVETMRRDGTDYQRCVALEWPCRLNHGDELRTIRLLISPEDAEGLADGLEHTARWMRAADALRPKAADGNWRLPEGPND